MDTISAPLLDNLIAKAQSCPDWLNRADKDCLLGIIEKLQPVTICGNDERRELWMTAERGPIEDFGDYNEYLESGEVESHEDFEQLWKGYYPNPVKWYLFSVSHYNEEYFIGMDGKLTIHIKKEPSAINESVNGGFISWIGQAVDKAINWIGKDTAGYNRHISQNLPYSRRTGRILRQHYWNIEPEEKEWMLKGLTAADINVLRSIAELSETDEQMVFKGEMTSGFFFDCCKMGYDANGYQYDTGLKPVDLYRIFADGRDDGLTQIDTESPQAFEEWFDKGGFRIGHPWEVCRGGNSTHISLYVDRQASGWRLSLAGKSRVRVAETVRFAIALHSRDIPFKLWDAKEIEAMVTGTDYIGIVPEEVRPVYCHSYFPKEERIIDFMNLPIENREEVINAAHWYPIDEIRLG